MSVNTLIAILMIATPLWVVYWLVIRKVVLERLQFELDAVIDEAVCLGVKAKASKDRADVDSARWICRWAEKLRDELPFLSMQRLMLTRVSDEARLQARAMDAVINSASKEVRALDQRAMRVCLGALFANSPILCLLLLALVVPWVVFSLWFNSAKAGLQNTEHTLRASTQNLQFA